jgi:hypothetical protein
VRNLTGAQHAVTWFELETLGSNFNNVFAFHGIEEFVYTVVKVTRRPSLLLI